jgi:hypothetical protein
MEIGHGRRVYPLDIHELADAAPHVQPLRIAALIVEL